MKNRAAILAIALLAAALPFAARAGGQVIEQVETYAIKGATGMGLYRSIGERGPLLGKVRTIAHTGFKLTWRRDYQNRGGSCVLASAVPKLVITTVLPKPAGTLPPALRQRWEAFIQGVRDHERVHGENLKAMAKEIEKATVGLSAENDSDCNRLRAKMQPILREISDARQQKDSEYDKLELGQGGAVHRLVMALVDGG